MGIDAHGLNFLRYVCAKAALGTTVMIGRQNVHDSVVNIAMSAKRLRPAPYGPFAEELLATEFGATNIDSMDVSDFEGATVLQDMNTPVPLALHGKYQTVMDYGSLEHVFDVAQALRNVIALCSAKSGQILHVLPANNQCGHGFWQFSPELFFSLYSEANGFKDTEVFVASLADEKSWYRASKPKYAKRLNIISKDRLYLLVRTTKVSVQKSLVVQQSDYVAAWDRGNPQGQPVVPLKRKNRIWQWYKKHILRGVMPSHRFGKRHPDLEWIDVQGVLKA
jgi:hypothetical protein